MTDGNDAVHSGGCLCGAVRFEATGTPKWVVNCHCRSCRRHTASPMTTFTGFADENFTIVAGEPKVFESSPQTRRTFCGDCGTPLTYFADWDPGMVHLYVCSLDSPDDFAPKFHVNFAEHVKWFDTVDDLKRYRSMSKSKT
jgi:hypothetical protein